MTAPIRPSTQPSMLDRARLWLQTLWEKRHPSVATLPGIGQGYVDSLNALTGGGPRSAVVADPWENQDPYWQGQFIAAGQYDPRDMVRISPEIADTTSARYREVSNWPRIVGKPTLPWIVAHEFGHKLTEPVPYQEGGRGEHRMQYIRDIAPAVTRQMSGEDFADAFANGMLNLRAGKNVAPGPFTVDVMRAMLAAGTNK